MRHYTLVSMGRKGKPPSSGLINNRKVHTKRRTQRVNTTTSQSAIDDECSSMKNGSMQVSGLARSTYQLCSSQFALSIDTVQLLC